MIKFTKSVVITIVVTILLIAFGACFIANSSLSINLTNEFTQKVEEPVRSPPTWRPCPAEYTMSNPINGICLGLYKPTRTVAQEKANCIAARGKWYDLNFSENAYTCQMEQIPGVITNPKEDNTSKGRKTFIQFISVISILGGIFIFALAFYVVMPNTFEWRQNLSNKLRDRFFPQPTAQT